MLKTTCDLWRMIRSEAVDLAASEPLLGSFIHATILNHDCLEDAISFELAAKLSTPSLHAMSIREVVDQAFRGDASSVVAICRDLEAFRSRDPAIETLYQPLLFAKGFHALQTHRVAHRLWLDGRKPLALVLQNRSSEVFGVDIHPAAQIGSGILMDHGTSVVIGETTVVDDDVSLLHEVTLGGTGKRRGDRHPVVRRGVLIGAGAKVLGRVEIGEGAKVGAGSVVLQDVPAHSTVAGVPAKVVGKPDVKSPALNMDHDLS